MAIDFSDVAKPIDEKQLPNQAQAGLVDFSDVAKPIGTNESRNANQWSPANGTIFDQIDQQKLMYDPNLPDATIGRVFMAGVKDAFEGYAGGSAMEAAESRNIMGMTPEQIKAHLGEGARNSLMGDYALTKMENIDNNYIKNKEGIKAGIRDGIVDKATALAKMADPGDYNLPTSFLGQLGHDMLRSTPYSMMSAVPSIATGALTGGAALPTLIVSFLTSMGEASSEGGRTYMSMIEAGKSHDEAYAAASKNKDFNTLMLTLSNMISGQLFGSVPRGIDEVNFAKLKGTPLSELSRAGQVMGKAMERPIISNIAKSPIKRGLVSLGSEFVMEGSEEMGQSVSDAVVRGEKINVPNLLYEGLVGGLSGAGQSSVGTAIDYAKNRGARAKYKKLAELMEIMKEKDTPEGGNNKVVAEAISKFKDNEHNVMFDSLNERNRILALPLEDRSALEEQALPVLSEAVNLFAQGKVEEGLSLLAEKNVNFDFEEEQTFPTKPQGPVKDVSMHSNETIGAIGEGPQLQEMARAEFNRLRSIPANQRTAKDNQALQAYRRVMEGYTAGNNLAGDLGFVAQRTVAEQPITANEHTQQSAPIPGRSFNNAQLAPVSERSPLDRTYVGEPRAVSGGFIINKPDGNAFFVPQAEMGGYYQVGNEQPQAQIPITPQPAQTQPIPKSKKQQKPAPVPQVRDGVGTNDIYQGGDGVAYWVRGFDANNKIVMADNTGSILRVTPEQLGQNFQRLSPARREQVSLSAPVRSEIPSLADQQKAAGKEQAAQQKQQTATTQKQAGQAAMPRTPELAKAAAKAKTEKQAKPTTEKTNTSTPAQTTTEQEQMARGKTAQTPSESTTTNEVKKEDKVPKETKGAQESTVKVGEKYKNKTGQTVIVKSVEDGNVSFDLETPGIMKPSPRSIEKFTENYKKIDDDTEYKVEPETEERTKRTVTTKDISSAVKGAKVRETKDGIISIQFKNGFVLNVDPNSDEIVINPEIVKRDYGRDPNSGDKIIGSATMVGNEGFIRLISGMADLKTFNHELYHIAEKMVLTKEQIAIVERAYGGSEERANAFADVAFKRKQAKNKLVTSLFQKIADFFADIRASIFGERAEDIFRHVAEGKAWEQELTRVNKSVTGITQKGEKMWVFAMPFGGKYMVLHHGTHKQKIDKFSLKYVNTGERAQMFGWGLYFTDSRGIAKQYRENVSASYNQRIADETAGYMFDVLLGGEVFVPNNRWLELTSDIINQIVDNTKWRTKGLNAVTAEALNDVEEEIKGRINNAKDHIKWTEVALETRESLLEENLRQGHLSSGEETENASIKTLKSDVDYAREKKQVAEKSLEGYERAYEWFKQNKNSITFRSRGTEGSLYTVEIPDDEGQYLYWDREWDKQSEKAQDAVIKLAEEHDIEFYGEYNQNRLDRTIDDLVRNLGDVDSFKDKLDMPSLVREFNGLAELWEPGQSYTEKIDMARWAVPEIKSALRELELRDKSLNNGVMSPQIERIIVATGIYVDKLETMVMNADHITGKNIYRSLSMALGSSKEASLALNEAGIIGIKYLNGMSRSKGEGGYNYVMFNDEAIQIIDESYKIANKAKSTTDKLSLDDPALTERDKEMLVKIDKYHSWEPSKTTKDGKIQGAPEWVKTDKHVEKLRKLLRQLLMEGVSGRFWYEDSGREVLVLVGGNIEEAAKFIQLLAIYSAKTKVDVNTTEAIKAWNMYKRGVSEDDFHVATSDQDTKAKNVLYRDDKWEGRKTGSFYVNLMFEILGDNPELAKTLEIDTDKLRATIDLWMYRAFGYVNESGGDDHKYGKYTFAESSIIKLAAELNRTRRLGDPIWTPHQVQAAIWTAMKTRYDNETVKEKTNALGVKQGLITYKDGKPVYPRDGSRAQKAHYANWRKFALAIPDSDSVRAEAELTGVSFAEYIKRMTQHVTLEVIPSSKLNEDINGASEATKRAFTERALGEIILDKDGNDQIAQLLGVPLSRTMTSDGAYDGGLNPNIITSLVPDKVREFDSNGNPKTTLAFNYDTARAYARIIQYIFKQDGVPWFTPNFVPLSKDATDKQRFRVVTGPKEKRRTVKVFDTLQEANKFLSKKNNDAYYVIGGDKAQAVMLTFSDDLTSQKLVNLLKLLETKFGKSAGFTRMSNREVAIVNFRDDETKVPSLDDEVFLESFSEIEKDLRAIGMEKAKHFYAEGEYGYVHNWKEDNTGSAILDRGSFRGRPDIQERVRVWRDLFEQLLKEYSGDSLRDKERAYVDRGTIRGSTNETNERDIGPDAEGETGEVKTQYPFKVEPDGNVRLFHWSSESGLTTLDPAMHGTGIRGAEATRKGNNEKNYVNRLYFGVNEGGYEKEARLGSSKYEVSVPLDKLYDMDGDPEGFGEESYKKAGSPYAHDDAATFFEKMVKEAGYLGMWKDVGYKKHSVVAMLFTPTEAKSIAYSNQSNDAPNEGYRIAGEESDSTFKAPPVTLRAIKRAVPGAKVSITKDGLVRIQFKNGFVVNVNLSAKSIKIDQDVMKRDYGREATAGDIAVGRNYVTVDGEAFIDIVSGMTDMRTFHHELYEVARRMALSGQQLDILDKAFKGNKEAEAEAYADFMVKRLANQSKLVNSLFQKISDFFSDIRAKLFGQNSEDIFRQIGDGKVAMGSNTMNNEAYRIADKLKALDKQYMDAVENGDMETAQRLVNEAAELAGLPILDDSATVAYKVRRGPAPSKTEKAYKLFSTKKSRGGELFPLFVGANDAIPQGVWLDAMEGPSAGESKTGKPQVKSKLGNLSFRPGWHTSDMPIASHIGVKDANGDIVARRANEVWAEVEVSADVDYQTEAGDKDIKHMPTDGMYRYKTNPNMPGKWIISGSMKVNRVLTENEVNQILEDNAIDPMVWENGELLLERLGFSPEAVSNTGKLADPVTYDDNGRVIPLSERFNPDISDPRYRIVGMGGQKFSSPAEVTMVTPADEQVSKQKVANLQYAPAPQTTWKTDSGRNKKDQAAWHALTDGLESVVEKREPRMTLKERIVHVKDWIVDNWIDNLSIIQRTADEKLYRHARGKVDGISSKAEKLIKFGDKKRGVEGLTQIFKGMSDEEFKGFLHYAEYKNIIDIINNSEEAMRFISKAYDEIASEKARLKELRSTKPLDADDAKQLARGIRGTVRYIEQLQKDIDHSLEYVREVRGKADQYLTTVMKMEKLYPDWVERQQKLTKYTNNLLRINRDSGMISANLYRFLTETRPNYLPALRDFSDEEGKVGLDSFIETRGFVNLKSPLRRMHGSKRDIVNPIDEIIANTFRTMSLEAKQSVATSFIDFYESRKDGDEYLWRTKPDKAIEEGHFMFFVRRDGEKHYYATDSPALYEALTLRSTSKINLGSVGKPAELITKMLRQATTRAVRFLIRNPERDNFQAGIYGEGFIPFVTAFRGGIEVVGGGEWFERFLEAGGAQGISTVDSDRLADMKAEILGKKFFRSKNPLKNIWNLLGRMAEVTELSTRVGQFTKAIELGYTDEEAAYIARDLMNFGIGGSDAKQMNRYVPFLTASIQDMNRFYRGHSKKNVAKTVRRAMMYITIPTLALWFWNNGDDDRKEYWDKLATWEKNAFWWIILNKDTAIPVAKPFLLGLVYGSLPERFMDYWLNNDRRAVEDFGKTLLAQTMPGYMPLALQLVMELGLNKSFFYGREIVPANEQKLEGKLQYGPYTAEWAKTLGSISGISPRKLEYAVFGVTGSLGKETSAVVDDVWRSVSGTTRPDKYITEYIPGSTAWISHGRNHMGPLYAWNLAFPALEEAYRSAKKVYEVDGADSLSDRQRLLLTYEGDVKAILKLNTAKDGIWKLQGLKNKVVVDKNMTAEQKRKAVDGINARIILLSQVGLKKLDFFQDAIDSMKDKMEARR